MGRVNIVFVLPRGTDPLLPLFRDLIAPVRDSGDRVECWLPCDTPESLPPAWPLIPHRVICGGADMWDIRHTGACLRWLEGLCGERRPDLILFPATPAGHELGTRLSARLNRNCFPETRALLREGNRLFARKKVCGSNLDWDADIGEYPVIVTVTGKKTIPGGGENGSPRIELRPAAPLTLPEWLLEYERSGLPSGNPPETAPLLFAAGRGLGSKAACDRLRRAAAAFGAPLGFSRPAALNGWGETAGIIGQSGIRAGAEVCVAVGVSGAAAFMAGIESVGALIAVNPDKNAPIFGYADIGIIAEAEEFISALETERISAPESLGR